MTCLERLQDLNRLAAELDLDTEQFSRDIHSAEIEEELQRQVDFARQSPIDGFPSLVMDVAGEMIAVTRDYKDPQPTLDHIEQLLSGAHPVAQLND